MSDEIEVLQIEPQPVACIRATTVPHDIAKTFAQILPEVGRYLREIGAQSVPPPYGRFLVYERDRVEMEGGIRVAEPITGNGRVEAGKLPGGEVASAWHVGPYTTLSRTHRAIEEWMTANGKEAAGAPWEMYWSDPGEEPDSSTWRTQVVYPIRAAAGTAGTARQ